MACLSVFAGYYTIGVFKIYGLTVEELNDDRFLTIVGSVASIFNAVRFVWSTLLDRYSYKQVYGSLLLIQIAVCGTFPFITNSQLLYAIWVCLIYFCEGAHFVLVPNILKKIFGAYATSLYGVAFAFTGTCSILMLLIL